MHHYWGFALVIIVPVCSASAIGEHVHNMILVNTQKGKTYFLSFLERAQNDCNVMEMHLYYMFMFTKHLVPQAPCLIYDGNGVTRKSREEGLITKLQAYSNTYKLEI